MSKSLGDRIYDWAVSDFEVDVSILIVQEDQDGEMLVTHFNRAAWDLWRINQTDTLKRLQIVNQKIIGNPLWTLMTNDAPIDHDDKIRSVGKRAVVIGEKLEDTYHFERMGAGGALPIDAFDGSTPKAELKFAAFKDTAKDELVYLAIAQEEGKAKGLLQNKLVSFAMKVSNPDVVDGFNNGLKKRYDAFLRLGITLGSIATVVGGIWKGPNLINELTQPDEPVKKAPAPAPEEKKGPKILPNGEILFD